MQYASNLCQLLQNSKQGYTYICIIIKYKSYAEAKKW